jgi:AAA domain-containing protein
MPNLDDLAIYELRAENYQKIRMVAIRPDGRPVVMLTGKNGQGKTSVLDSVWFALKGTEPFKRGKKDRSGIIRNGAESMTVTLKMRDGSNREVIVTRRMGQAGNQPALTVEGRGDMKPQEFLDSLLSALTFDPLDFVNMEPLLQVEELKKLGKVSLDFAALDDENARDYEERTIVGRERDTLQGQLDGMRTLAGLPKEKLDEAALFEKLNRAGEANERARKLDTEKRQLGATAAQLGVDKVKKQGEIDYLEEEIRKLQGQIKQRAAELKTLEIEHAKAEKIFKAAPEGEFVDPTAISVQLQRAQETNRAIDERERYDKIKAQIDAKDQTYVRLTNQMNVRESRKKEAIRDAVIPIPGLSFDATHVRYKGTALSNLGEGEQLRIATQIGIATNPKLRIMCIRHGEALDEDGLKSIAALAEEHKFQVWMARVDSSGKCGIVMEDGMIVADNDKEKK